MLIYPHIGCPSFFSRPPEHEKHQVPSLNLQGGEDRNAMMDKPWKTQNRSFSSSVRLAHAGKRGPCGEVGRGAITFELSRCFLEPHSLTKMKCNWKRPRKGISTETLQHVLKLFNSPPDFFPGTLHLSAKTLKLTTMFFSHQDPQNLNLTPKPLLPMLTQNGILGIPNEHSNRLHP